MPNPRPWCLSATEKATSAEVASCPSRSYRATADHLAIEKGDQGHPIRVVDLGEELDLLRLQGLLDPKEPEVSGLRAECLEEVPQ